MKIQNNVEKIKKGIREISLVAVTKSRSIDEIKETIDSGIKTIGENRIQEAEEKYAVLKNYLRENKVSFHFIGHLQSNKVKKAVLVFDVIQSVDSFELAYDIDKIAGEINKIQEIFVQVNIGKEKQKSGVMPHKAISLIEDIKKLKNINLTCLMCIPPYSENPEESRKYFRKMKKLFDKTKLKYLSMGMSSDYIIAIEEGSNMIRIGRGIFE